MPHRAETILDAVVSTLSGLTTTGTRVERTRVWAISECPAISIEKGDDQAIEDRRTFTFQDRQLEIVVTAYVKTKGVSPETQLNQIAAEVYTAMFANVTHGLDFVIDTYWLADSRPDISKESDGRAGKMHMIFVVTYRHSLLNPEN